MPSPHTGAHVAADGLANRARTAILAHSARPHDVSTLASATQRLPATTRLLSASALITVVTLVYLASNHFPLRTPQPLPFTAIDRVIGWHAWAIWPYWLLLVIAPAFILAISDRRIFFATLRAYAVGMAANAAVWLLWPTRLVRNGVPTGLHDATDSAWRLLHWLDSNINCFPSAHITAPIVAVTGYCAQHPQARRWAWPFAIALMPSVVATGQHYAWDILGGAVTAALGLWLVRRDLHA